MRTYLLSLVLAVVTSSAVAGDRFIVITDSHGVGRFGEVLTQHLRQRQETKFYFFASGGSAPLQWLNNAFTSTCAFVEADSTPAEARACKKLLTPRLEDLWAKFPRVASERRISVIVQGTNYSLDPKLKEEQVRFTRKLIAVALKESDECIWVGPPNMRRSPGFDAVDVEKKMDIIKEALGTCHLIDSRDFSTYPASGDGIHYHWPGSLKPDQLQAAEGWSMGLAQRLEELL